MTYQPTGLGQLIVKALRTSVRDPELYKQVDEASERLDELTSRLEDFVADIEQNELLDSRQEQELTGIKTELTDLATALSGGIMEEVEDPNADTGEVVDTPADVPVVNEPAVEAEPDVVPPVNVEVDTTADDYMPWDKEDNPG
jgi:hypothetical protein